MDIHYAQEPHLRIALIQPDGVYVLLPTGGRPLVVDGRLLNVRDPDAFGSYRSVAEWRQWVERFAVAHHLRDES